MPCAADPRLTGLALRSDVRLAPDRESFNAQELAGPPLIYVQAAYAKETPKAAAVVRWLAGKRAITRFAALGLTGPGPDPTHGAPQNP
ncbi:MAG: hypothetical protein ACR2NB_11635 [Solirubrobacteraceae bacterium]